MGSRRLRWATLVPVALVTALAAPAASAHSDGESGGPAGAAVVIANETSLADTAVAVGIAASERGTSVVLAESADALGERAAGSLAARVPQQVTLVGGESVLSSAVGREIAGLAPGADIERIAGSNRVGTSLMALRRITEASSPDSLVIVHGWTPADMAHGAAVVASGGADGLLLASCGKLEDAVSAAVEGNRFRRIVLAGMLATARCPSGALIEEVVGSGALERHEDSEPVEVVAAANGGRLPAELHRGVLVDAANLRELAAGAAAAAGDPGTLVLYTHRDRVSEVSALTLVDWYPESLTLIGSASWLVEGVGSARQDDAPGVSTSRTVYESVEAGNAHICGLLESGQIECWGDHRDGRTEVPDGSYQAVAAGFRHTCALDASSRVVCWGRTTYGRANPPSGKFSTVAAGWQHSCGITEAKSLRCWGRARDGATFPPSGQFTSLSAGGGHTCALRTDGRIACWGANGDGESLPPSGRFIAVQVGYAHSCGIRTNGQIVCWGANIEGQKDAPSGRFVDLSLGQNFGCALDRGGSIECWGANRDGEGDAPRGSFVDIEVGGKVSCGLRTDGRVTCWGFRSLPAVADVILP